MKRLVLLTLLTVMLALTIGQVAFAETCEEKICKMATENEKVTAAQCIIYERCCVVAIKTEKFTSRNEYEQFVKELTKQIQAECGVDHVFITRNPKAMAQIGKLADKSETEREELIKQLLDKEMFRDKIDRKLALPKRAISQR